MINFVSENNHKNLILFVHGFNSGNDTWKNGNGSTFPVLLLEDSDVASRFDVAYFEYYTKLFNTFSKVNNTKKILSKILKFSSQKLKKNNSIEEIANLLKSEIRFKLNKYDNIYVVAHSMGGLVTKSCILSEVSEKTTSKIKLFISLAVPHMGANLATFGDLVSKNIQIEQLSPLNQLLHKLNDSWLKTSLRPTTKYFYGVHDVVVPKESAIPIDHSSPDTVAVDENHFSISSPENSSSTTYLATLEFIKNYAELDPATSSYSIQTLSNPDSFNDELFVLKLLSAEINNETVLESKEVYLNAEYIRKQFDTESDQKRLSELYKKIRKIYTQSYNRYLNNGILNSGLLVCDVHDRILEEDNKFLETTFFPFVNAIHKQGMIHQLANNPEDKIWWGKVKEITVKDE